VRAEAAVALAKFGVTETIELARHWLVHERSPELRLAATRILLEFHAPDAARALRPLLDDEHTRKAALELAGSASVPALTPALIQLARRAGDEDRAAIFAALGLAGTREAFSFLGGALGARVSSSAAALALALAPSPDAEAALSHALDSASTRRVAVRASMARIAALGRTPSGLNHALNQLAASRDPADRAVLAQAKALFSPSSLAESLPRASDDEVRAVARDALVPQVARALAARLASEVNPALRDALASCLASPSAAELVPSDVLFALLEARGLAAPLAARALALRDSPTLRPKILNLLASDDAVLRSHAALGLGRSEAASALGVLEHAYRFETDDEVRLAIVHALAERPEPAKKRALTLARTLDASSAVREAAALALSSAEPASELGGNANAWLDLLVAPASPKPLRGAALVIAANGLALPAFADPDGVLLLPALPAGPFSLRLAAEPGTEDARKPEAP
ncbi:MAG TPA: HEAT repeat domain-containing protein, partial [Polyangiaceae bacterium]